MVLIIAKNPEERRRMLESILPAYEQPVLFFTSDQLPLFLQEIETFPMFSKSKTVVLQDIDQLSQSALEQLRQFVIKPHPWISLCLTAAHFSAQSKFVKSCERVIQATGEKQWEKEKRHVQWVTDHAASVGVEIAEAMAHLFVQYVDPQFLQPELDKLICYIGEEGIVTAGAIRAICTAAHHDTLWQLGDEIFARQSAPAIQIGKTLLADGLAIIPLLAHLRTQFRTALKIHTLYQQEGKLAVAKAFPYLKGGLLDKKVSAVHHYGVLQLKRGIVCLFDAELEAKNSNWHPELIVETLLAKLTDDSLSITQSTGSF